jgi:hypothetical protein
MAIESGHLLWAEDGAWFQNYDSVSQCVCVSHLGMCDSLEGLQAFSERAGIPLAVSKRLNVAQRHVARATEAHGFSRESSTAEKDLFADRPGDGGGMSTPSKRFSS